MGARWLSMGKLVGFKRFGSIPKVISDEAKDKIMYMFV